ncbi:MAG: tetratricopeptide repeat protein [Caldisericaceae bacterium]
MVKKIYLYIFISLIFSSFVFAQQNIPDEARREFKLGLAWVEAAKSREELKTAASVFQRAINYAPDWPDAHYNLGMVCDKLERYDCAITHLKKYLELSPNALDTSEVMQVIENGKQKIEKINQIKKMMTCKRLWKFVEVNPKVDMDTPKTYVSTEFRFADNKMSARHPYLINLKDPLPVSIREPWSTVEFDGRYFEYRYKVWFKVLNPSRDERDEYVLRIIRGEIILDSPVKIRQKVFFMPSPTLTGKNETEHLSGEVIYELQ